jgi:hypothetical protein
MVRSERDPDWQATCHVEAGTDTGRPACPENAAQGYKTAASHPGNTMGLPGGRSSLIEWWTWAVSGGLAGPHPAARAPGGQHD